MKIKVRVENCGRYINKEYTLTELKNLIRAFEARGYKRKVKRTSLFHLETRFGGGIPLTLSTCSEYNAVSIYKVA